MTDIRYTEKAVLHAHPHFYDLGTGRIKTIDEKVFRTIQKVPNLRMIVDHYIDHGFSIGVISACHAAKGHVDNRFEEYVQQLHDLEDVYDLDNHLNNGWIAIRKKDSKESTPNLILVKSQEIRTIYKNRSADINILGGLGNISAGEDLIDTANIAKDQERCVTICHPNSIIHGVGLESAIRLLYGGKVDCIEGFNATESVEKNEELGKVLLEKRINGISVPDSHYYTQTSAWTLFDRELVERFSMKELIFRINAQNFDVHNEYIAPIQKHLTHTLPIVVSFLLRPAQLKQFFRKQ